MRDIRLMVCQRFTFIHLNVPFVRVAKEWGRKRNETLYSFISWFYFCFSLFSLSFSASKIFLSTSKRMKRHEVIVARNSWIVDFIQCDNSLRLVHQWHFNINQLSLPYKHLWKCDMWRKIASSHWLNERKN